jgi:hypothetical protein
MTLFESRDAGDGTHYVVASGSGLLAHTEDAEGYMRAAVGLTQEQADEAAQQLNRAALGRS